ADGAREIHHEEVDRCRRMAEHAAALLEPGTRALTHCNAGGLATGGYGTAVGALRAAWEHGLLDHVLVDETRPLLQGARLTAWELEEAGIPHSVIADSAAPTGAEIPIEERPGEEVTARFAARNPAFDVTPAALIAAIVTEHGVHRAPYADSLAGAVASRRLDGGDRGARARALPVPERA